MDLARQQLLIGGNWTDAGSGGTYEQRFPYDGTAVGTAAAAGREDARAAVDAAHAAFGEWSRSAPGQRRAILLKAAELLLERAPEIAGIVTEETGGVFGWGMFNVELAAGMLREAAALWSDVTQARGMDARDALWAHPDLLPTAEDLANPETFLRGANELDISDLEEGGSATDGD